jgi:hypothetical protein
VSYNLLLSHLNALFKSKILNICIIARCVKRVVKKEGKILINNIITFFPLFSGMVGF